MSDYEDDYIHEAIHGGEAARTNSRNTGTESSSSGANNNNITLKEAAAELIGSMIYVVFGFGASLATAASSSPYGVITVPRIMTIALGYGLGAASATALAPLGHFNPAVTLCALMTRTMSTMRAIAFFVMQFVGAMLGAMLAMGTVPDEEWKNVPGPISAEGVTFGTAIASEVVATFILCYVMTHSAQLFKGAISLATSRGANAALIAITGFSAGNMTFVRACVETAAHIFGGSTSGALMSPAVALSISVVSGEYTALWLFWIGPIVGAICASVLYMAVAKESKKPLGR